MWVNPASVYRGSVTFHEALSGGGGGEGVVVAAAVSPGGPVVTMRQMLAELAHHKPVLHSVTPKAP